MTIFFIAGVIFLIALWRREYGLGAVILLLPAYLLRTTVVGIPTTALELSIYAVFLAWVIRDAARRQFIWPKLPSWALISLVFWVLAWVIATIFSQDQQASLGAMKAWLIDPLLFALILFSATRSVSQRTMLFASLALSGTVVSVAGLAQLIWFRDTLQDNRLSSFFHPVANYAAMFLGPILVLTIGAILWKILDRRWMYAVGMMLLAMFLTFSFGGYLAIAAGGIFLWWRWPNNIAKRRVLVISLLAIVLGGTLIATMTPYLKEKINFTDRSSSLVRTQIWRTSWQMIVEHPIVGIGPNAYEPVYRATIPKLYFPPLEWLVSQPHQLYLALWLETGLLGLLTFLAFGWFWAKRCWPRIRSGDGATVIAMAAMIAILAHGLVDTPLFKNDLMILFVLVVMMPLIGQPETAETKN